MSIRILVRGNQALALTTVSSGIDWSAARREMPARRDRGVTTRVHHRPPLVTPPGFWGWDIGMVLPLWRGGCLVRLGRRLMCRDKNHRLAACKGRAKASYQVV